MNRILLVDDDAFFRSMFAGLLNWSKYGYSVSQADTGRTAIQILNRDPTIRLVFTDMHMPAMDGVELIRYIGAHFPDIRVVALSAYDDFNYVKQSLLGGAADYVLKHSLTREHLASFLEKPPQADQAAGPEAGAAVVSDEQRAAFLAELIAGQYDHAKNLPEMFSALSLPVITHNILLSLLVIHTPDGKLPKPSTSVHVPIRTMQGIMQSILDRLGAGIVFYHPEEERFYALQTSEGFLDLQFARETADLFAKQIENAARRYFNIPVSLHSAPLSRTLGDLDSMRRMLHGQLGLKSLPGKARHHKGDLLLPDQTQMERELTYGTPASLGEAIARYYQMGRTLHYSSAQFTDLSMQIANLHAGLAQSLSPCDSGHILTLATDGEQQAYITEAYRELQPLFAQKEQARYSSMVYRAMCTIFQQCDNHELSLRYLADKLNVNPSYLSRVFKSETGGNISECINKNRVERAKELFRSSQLTVKEVSDACGFENYNYFFSVFKKHTGLTPKAYSSEG